MSHVGESFLKSACMPSVYNKPPAELHTEDKLANRVNRVATQPLKAGSYVTADLGTQNIGMSFM